MPAVRIHISIDLAELRGVDETVRRGGAKTRSQFIGRAVRALLARQSPSRLARECAKLDPQLERAEAVRWPAGESALSQL